MLKAMVAGLLSMTALVPPVLAQDRGAQDRGMQDGRSMDRGQWRRDRAEMPAPPPRSAGDGGTAGAVDRPSAPAPGRWERDAAPGRRDPARADRDDRPPAPNGDWRSGRPPAPRDDSRFDDPPRPSVPNGDWRSERPPTPRGDWRNDRAAQDRRDDWRDPARRAPDRVWSAEPGRRRYDRRDAPRPPAAVWRAESVGRWDREWRREPQYDWNRYRNERRSVFRLPRYYAPYGWQGGYRRFDVGIAIAPILYTPRYWIYDPYAYRLPDAGEPYRWVRYYDDALLVDIEDGTVVDVIHGIFE